MIFNCVFPILILVVDLADRLIQLHMDRALDCACDCDLFSDLMERGMCVVTVCSLIYGKQSWCWLWQNVYIASCHYDVRKSTSQKINSGPKIRPKLEVLRILTEKQLSQAFCSAS